MNIYHTIKMILGWFLPKNHLKLDTLFYQILIHALESYALMVVHVKHTVPNHLNMSVDVLKDSQQNLNLILLVDHNVLVSHQSNSIGMH